MSAPRSFFRYVIGRYCGRLSAAKNSAVKSFVLTWVAGQDEFSNLKFWVGAACSVLFYLIRIVKAIFDSIFEAIGFLFGRILLPRHLIVRIIIGLVALIWVCFSVRGQSSWFIAFWIALFAVNLLPAIGVGALGEPRLLTASVKAYSLVAVSFWAWRFGSLSALFAYLLTRRAFQFINEGMTICAAELMQARRDSQTETLFHEIKKHQRAPHQRERIILYLRPFAITNRIKMDDGEFLEAADQTAITDLHDPKTKKWQRTIMPVTSVNIGVTEAASLFELGCEYEATIQQGMNGAGQFIALGQSGEAIGAGRLPSLESEWRDTVQLMIEAATLCIVIPSANPGTLWEIEYLADNNHLGKCCVFMPPTIGKFSYEMEWRAAREALAEKLPLPEYQSNGGVFRCDGKIPTERPNVESMPRDKSEMFALGVQLLFPEVPKWKVKSRGGWFHFGIRLNASTYVGGGESQ